MTWSDDVCDDVIYILLPSSHLSVLSVLPEELSQPPQSGDKWYHTEQRRNEMTKYKIKVTYPGK